VPLLGFAPKEQCPDFGLAENELKSVVCLASERRPQHHRVRQFRMGRPPHRFDRVRAFHLPIFVFSLFVRTFSFVELFHYANSPLKYLDLPRLSRLQTTNCSLTEKYQSCHRSTIYVFLHPLQIVFELQRNSHCRKQLYPRTMSGVRQILNWTCNVLVPVTSISLCHFGFESQGAYAAQI
jgi:hypothetical protein